MKKILKYLGIFYIIILTSMVFSWSIWHIEEGGKLIRSDISDLLLTFARIPSLSVEFIKDSFKKDLRVISDSSNYSGLNYFVDTSKLSEGSLLISSFSNRNNLQIILLDYKKNHIIKKWIIQSDKILKFEPFTFEKKTLRLGHPFLLKDSSIILSWGSLLKIDKDSKILWVNELYFHHSIEAESDSKIWVCGSTKRKNNQIEDFIISVNSNTGKIITRKSVFQLLIDNGFEYLIESGQFVKDPFHLNDIQPAISNTKYWNKGDLLISMRHKNTIFLYRPSTNKIIWLKTGPWFLQHDCDFIDSSRIMVYGNNLSNFNNFISDSQFNKLYNKIFIYNFENNSIDSTYSNILSKLKIKTITEGRCDLMSNGDMLVDETNNGKIYILNKDSAKLLYVDRIDKSHIKMFNWVRYLPNKRN